MEERPLGAGRARASQLKFGRAGSYGPMCSCNRLPLTLAKRPRVLRARGRYKGSGASTKPTLRVRKRFQNIWFIAVRLATPRFNDIFVLASLLQFWVYKCSLYPAFLERHSGSKSPFTPDSNDKSGIES